LTRNDPVVLQLQTDYIAKMRGRNERYTVTRNGRAYDVLPNVFPPYIDSELITRVMHIEKGDEVLDVGSGSGFIAVTAAATAKRVVATDINPAAIDTIRANAARHRVRDRLTAHKADVFPERKDAFDVVTFNPPFSDHAAIDVVERSVWDPGHATVRRFLAGVGDYLKPGGRIYMSWADFADLQFIEALFDEHEASYMRLDHVSDGTSIFVAYEVTFEV
jgi:release factor glutamine methyltransferase